MRTYFCFLIPRTDVCAYLSKRYAQLLLLIAISTTATYAQTIKCVGGLDSIQQVSIVLDCDRDVNVIWDAHPGMCYTFSIPGVMTLSNVSSGLVSFSGSGTGISSGLRFYINESCSDDIAINGCNDYSSTSTSVDIYSGVLPDLTTVGTWSFSASGVGGNTTQDAVSFISSSTDLPNIIGESSLSAVTSSTVRPSGAATSDARYCIDVSFIASTLDSVLLTGDNVLGSLSSGLLGTRSSHEFCLSGASAGDQINQIIAVSGKCRDTIPHVTNIRPGSDIPSLACHGLINISVTGSGTIITPKMMLPGQSTTNRVVMVAGRPNNIVNCQDAGERFEVAVIDTIYNQKCWGYLDVSYKGALSLTALDTSIYCLDDMSSLTSSDLLVLNSGDCVNTDDVSISFGDEIIGGECYSGDTLKLIERTWIVRDHRGAIRNVTSNILIKKIPFDTLVFPGDTTLYCPDTSLLADRSAGLNLNIDTVLNYCKLQVAFSDREIPTGCSGMKKLERTWLAVDWCNNTDTTHIQIITVLDTVPPVFDCPRGDSLGRTEIVTTQDTCGAYFRIPNFVATDACSDDNLITYQIKVNGVLTGGADSIFMPVGENIIEYSAEDDCGNRASCVDTVIVKDRSQPRLSGPTIIQIAQAGTSNTLVPMHLVIGAYDISDACALDSVKIRRVTSICGVPSDTLFGEGIHICCEDSGTPVMIELWAKDTAGNVNTMMSSIDVKASPDCPVTTPLTDDETDTNETKSLIVGLIEDPFSKGLGGMEASLLINQDVSETISTDYEGVFIFESEEANLSDNTIALSGYGDDMQGISTVDLFLIQRHILGLSQIDNEYINLAADIDQSGNVSVKDLIVLQNAILGLNKEQVTPWKFMPANRVANNIVYSSSDIIPIDNELKFTAYKVGDINGDIYDQAKGRNRSFSSLMLEEASVIMDKRTSLPISLESTNGIVSFELDVEMDNLKDVIFHSSQIQDVTIEWTYTSFGIRIIGYGDIPKSGITEIGEIHFTPLRSGSLKDLIQINQQSSAYYDNNLLRHGLYLDWLSDGEKIDNQNLFDVYPNPAVDKINFDIFSDFMSIETFVITDITGRVVLDLTDDIEAKMTISTDQLPSAGSYLVTMRSAHGTKNEILIIHKE